jgi:isopenicillin-N epimerase
MPLTRRGFLARTGVIVTAGVVAGCEHERTQPETTGVGEFAEQRDFRSGDEWDEVREQFAVSNDYIDMSALLIATHPRPVREAIERHRREIDANPTVYLEDHNSRLRDSARAAAGRYLGVRGSDIALTDSTTMGLGLVYNGMRLKSGEEILTTEHDYFVTHQATRQAAERTGATVRHIRLFEQVEQVSADEIVDRIVQAIRPETRVLALTWVHSSTGLKLPLQQVGKAMERVNDRRDDGDRVLICVDGVHGFGNQDFEFADLGCDFFMAGCHKWLFGPRGTGIVAATTCGWRATMPTIPSFIDDDMFAAWIDSREPSAPTTADSMTPGGFKPFEHQWAMTEAFEFQQKIGKAKVAQRTAELAAHLKDGLAGMRHIALRTPRAPELSAGIVSFDVEGFSPWAAVRRLRSRGLIATVAPYAERYVRLTPSIRNSPAEIEAALREVRALAT